LSASIIRGALPMLSSLQAARNGEPAPVNSPLDWSLQLVAAVQVVVVDVSMRRRIPVIRSPSSCAPCLADPAGLAHRRRAASRFRRSR
jgi:hypothetical protein